MISQQQTTNIVVKLQLRQIIIDYYCPVVLVVLDFLGSRLDNGINHSTDPPSQKIVDPVIEIAKAHSLFHHAQDLDAVVFHGCVSLFNTCLCQCFKQWIHYTTFICIVVGR
jgi:hypothetical protein